MRGKYRPHYILEVILLFIALAGFSASNSKANENIKYLDAVREFADNVLKYGRDTYGPKHTPLFVDGLNIHNHEPVKWISACRCCKRFSKRRGARPDKNCPFGK